MAARHVLVDVVHRSKLWLAPKYQKEIDSCIGYILCE
jgi:hypothetical protein